MVIASIFTDSMLSCMDPPQQHYLKTSLNLNELNIYPFPGKTAQFLLADLFVQGEIEKNRFDIVFFSCGQNDVSRALSSESALSGKSAKLIASSIMNQLTPRIFSITSRFPSTKFVFLPLTLRIPARRPNPKYPESQESEYVCRINQVLAFLVTWLLELDISNFLFVEGPKLWDFPDTLTSKDGLHLSKEGLEEYLLSSIIELKRRVYI